MNEKYKLNKEWLDLLLEHKNNANITFNLSNNDTRILLTYIEFLQQENQQLKDRINKTIEYIEKSAGETWFDYDDLLKILKEDNKEKVDE